MNKTIAAIVALLAAAAIFFSVNILVQRTARGARIDLSEGRLYTLSDGSRKIAASLAEPITLSLYFTDKQANDAPQLKAYAQRVKELLQEFASSSAGKIDVRIINPEPFSNAEDAAVQAGLAGLPTGRGNDRLYFGLVGANRTGKQEIIAFFDPQKEEFLEYDLTRLVFLLSDAPKKTVGVLSWLPIDGGGFNPMQQTPPKPFQIYKQLQELFDVKKLELTLTEIPQDIKVLLLVHPKGMTPGMQYAIDQFVLRGGRLLAFVDPLCESDVPPGMNPMQAISFPKASSLDPLLAAWGVEMPKDQVAADRGSALRVNAGGASRPEPVDYIAWLQLKDDRRDSSDPITGQLQNIIMASPGFLKPKDGATTTFQPLLRTTTNAAPMDAGKISFMPDPKKLLGEFKSEGKELVLAARITGKVKSALPDGPPKPPEPAPNEPAPKPPTQAHIAESAEPIGVIIVADCDMLADRFWASEERLGPIVLGMRKISDNGDLVTGALDNLSGSSDLMSLRARGKAARPFSRVQQLQKDAEQRYAAKENELQTRLRDTEQKIQELQRSRTDDKGGALILSPEQQAEIEKFRVQMIDTRRELREVQHQLRKDIEGLGSTIKAINIALMPALVGVGALGLAAYRATRRTADRKAAAARE